MVFKINYRDRITCSLFYHSCILSMKSCLYICPHAYNMNDATEYSRLHGSARWLVFLPLYFSVALFVAIPCLQRVASWQKVEKRMIEIGIDWDSEGRKKEPLLYTAVTVISCDHGGYSEPSISLRACAH